MVEQFEEKKWIRAAIEGDEKAYKFLIDNNYKMVERFARQIGAPPQEVQDIVQEVFIRVFRFLPKYTYGKFSTWLYSITYNVTKDYFRKQQRENRKMDRMADQGKNHFYYEENWDLSEDAALLHEAIQILDVKYRVPIVLFYFQELSIKDIAKVMNIGESTVKTRLKRGRERLKIALQKGGFNDESKALS